MVEQASAMGQVTQATDAIRRQTDQTSKGMAEQTRAAAELTSATRNVAMQMGLIMRANKEQAEAVASAAQQLTEAQRAGANAVIGARDTLALSQQLAERARAFGQS